MESVPVTLTNREKKINRTPVSNGLHEKVTKRQNIKNINSKIRV
jgi:hypothetical protein